MSIVSRTTLKTYFNDGDAPDEGNHEDLIDSFNHVDNNEFATMCIESPVAGDSSVLLVADRVMTVTFFNLFQNAAVPNFYDVSLRKNSAGVITDLFSGGTSPLPSNPNISTTSSGYSVTNTQLLAGDVLYITMNTVSVSTDLYVIVRYK